MFKFYFERRSLFLELLRVNKLGKEPVDLFVLVIALLTLTDVDVVLRKKVFPCPFFGSFFVVLTGHSFGCLKLVLSVAILYSVKIFILIFLALI